MLLQEFIRQIVSEELDDFRLNTALLEIDKITKAKEFARDVHSGQWRKTSPLPYMAHPMRVYGRAKQRGLSKKHLILAILHDTYEDSKNPPRTLKKIKELFGSNIAKIVKLLSHDKGVDYSLYLAKLAKASKTAFDVKLLDMEDNLSEHPTEKQKRKYGEALRYLIQLGINIDSKIKNNLFTMVGI
jgi:(p)ppGpp synthase/HD superfamily hydrolase